MQKPLDYAQAHRDEHLDDLFQFLRIPSVSTQPKHADDIRVAADWLKDRMEAASLDNVQVMPTDGHPVVYGEWLGAGEDAHTVLIYGHYDVQPVDDEVDEVIVHPPKWDSPPFEPEIRDGAIYARGASDDKGQMYAHIKAIQSILETEGELPVNVKLLFEGEEEIGSVNLEPFVLEHREMLAADSVLVSDTNFLGEGKPLIVYGLRGLTYMEILLSGPSHDLHSGGYGGTVHNPAQALAEIIAALHDEDGTITIPGFYDKVQEIPEEERAALNEVPYTLDMWKDETGMEQPWGEPDYTIVERKGARPTCEVNGIWGGFSGEGGKTIIPAEAGAKISMRLVPDQDPDEIAELFTTYIERLKPESLELEVNYLSGGWPAITPIDALEMEAAAQALETMWGERPVLSREGGSIPIVATFQKELDTPVVLMGFGLPGSNVHAPNEHYREEHYYKSIETLIRYFYNLAE